MSRLELMHVKFDDKQVLLDWVKREGLLLSYSNKELRNDPEVVLAAVKQDGRALLYTSEELRNNPEIVLAAVSQNGLALEYALEDLQNNPEIVFAAIVQNHNSFKFASNKLKKDKDFLLECSKKNLLIVEYFPQDLFEDSGMLDFIISQSEDLLSRFSVRFLVKIIKEINKWGLR